MAYVLSTNLDKFSPVVFSIMTGAAFNFTPTKATLAPRSFYNLHSKIDYRVLHVVFRVLRPEAVCNSSFRRMLTSNGGRLKMIVNSRVYRQCSTLLPKLITVLCLSEGLMCRPYEPKARIGFPCINSRCHSSLIHLNDMENHEQYHTVPKARCSRSKRRQKKRLAGWFKVIKTWLTHVLLISDGQMESAT